MTREELLELFEDTISQCRLIIEAKNKDYSNDTDPFLNFRSANFLGVAPEIGILMRSMDKFQRIRTFTEKGELSVKSESVEDAIHDVINYMILLKGLIRERSLL
jgi:hypothetical protein